LAEDQSRVCFFLLAGQGGGSITDYKGAIAGNNPEYCQCYGGREKRSEDDYAVLQKSSSVVRCVGGRKMIRTRRSPNREMDAV